jgi:anti-anti-sigma regulatory factor
MMLRVEFQDTPRAIMIRIEGRLVGGLAKNLQGFVARSRIPSEIVVNMSEVTSIDSVGEDVLSWFRQIGVKFIADTAYSVDVCERLHLPLLRKRVWAPQH